MGFSGSKKILVLAKEYHCEQIYFIRMHSWGLKSIELSGDKYTILQTAITPKNVNFLWICSNKVIRKHQYVYGALKACNGETRKNEVSRTRNESIEKQGCMKNWPENGKG